MRAAILYTEAYQARQFKPRVARVKALKKMCQDTDTVHLAAGKRKKQPARATRFLPDEDERLIELKEKRGLPWSRIVKHFPGRTKGSLQVRYSTRLKDRGTGSPRQGRNRRVTYPTAVAVTPQETSGLLPRSPRRTRKQSS
ncbi:Homeodomain-like [Penicillium roqueforti FM164]|uniref:Homeodomain-like n=1 Tax=Penicillium roqueforti (strain FM164) TaxID=1365484 RepID=W6PVP6_PENRF|nr:Homeodomain-like [Penicillium roqueforti FM164]